MNHEHNSSAMKNRFDEIVDRMPDDLRKLNECPHIGMYSNQERRNLRPELLRNANIEIIKGSKPATGPGNYVLYEKGRAMYTGRTDHLPERLLEHGNQGGSETATFAFLLAREEYLKMHPNSSLTRKDLSAQPEFHKLFGFARESVKKMSIKAVGIDDPIEQTLFEVYTHLVLETPYNSFENH